MKRSLPRWILPESRLNYTAHDHFIDILGAYTGTLDRFAHGDSTELRRFETFERAEKLSHGCADGANDYCFFDL